MNPICNVEKQDFAAVSGFDFSFSPVCPVLFFSGDNIIAIESPSDENESAHSEPDKVDMKYFSVHNVMF